jgi:predicted PurR-regulated permease PerM
MDASVLLVLTVFGVVLAVLWILIPFAIFGIKPLLRQLTGHLETIEQQNRQLLAELRDSRRAPSSAGEKPIEIYCSQQSVPGSD